MNQARPQTIAGTLLNEVQVYVDHPEQVTEFGLRKLEREADRLLKADAATGSTVKAAIAAFRWDAEAVEYWTDRALRLGRSYSVLANGAINKGLVGQVREAADLAVEAMQYANNDADAALRTCHTLMFDARFEEALSLSDKFSRCTEELEKLALHAESALESLTLLGIDQAEVRHQVEIGALVAKDHQVRITAIEAFGVDDFEDGGRFVASLHVVGDIHTEIAMDEALAEKFLDDPNWDPMRLSVEFHYLTPDELQSY